MWVSWLASSRAAPPRSRPRLLTRAHRRDGRAVVVFRGALAVWRVLLLEWSSFVAVGCRAFIAHSRRSSSRSLSRSPAARRIASLVCVPI